jgi:hypothetical protein
VKYPDTPLIRSLIRPGGPRGVLGDFPDGWISGYRVMIKGWIQ